MESGKFLEWNYHLISYQQWNFFRNSSRQGPQAEVDYKCYGERSCSFASLRASAVERAAYCNKVADISERDQEKIGEILAKEAAGWDQRQSER